MGDGGEDLGAVANDATLERNERFDAAAPCPGDPSVQCLAGLVGGQFEDRAQAFLEEVGAVEPWVGLGAPFQLHPVGGRCGSPGSAPARTVRVAVLALLRWTRWRVDHGPTRDCGCDLRGGPCSTPRDAR